MRHLLLTIQYRGTAYHGFQVQANALAVAQVLQDAVERVFESRLDIKGCSRTDTGVHANRFALTLRTATGIPCDAVVRAMNIQLPLDIAVLACREVAEDFHPRYDCVGKRYIYKIWNAEVKNAFMSDLVLHCKYPLDHERMHAMAQELVGTYDFRAFCAAGAKPMMDTVRTISRASVTRTGDLVEFSVTGSGFLYNMVRIIAGTLLQAGKGELAPGAVREIIASSDRLCAGATAPPHGLYLDAVFYSDGEL